MRRSRAAQRCQENLLSLLSSIHGGPAHHPTAPFPRAYAWGSLIPSASKLSKGGGQVMSLCEVASEFEKQASECTSDEGLRSLLDDVARELGFQHYAMVHSV